jgi:glutaredoxin 3
MNVTVYSRVDYCPYCMKAKNLLSEKGIDFKEVVVGIDIDKDSFKDKINTDYGIVPQTVPQIIIDGNLVGGYDDLVTFLSKDCDKEPLSVEVDDFSDFSL